VSLLTRFTFGKSSIAIHVTHQLLLVTYTRYEEVFKVLASKLFVAGDRKSRTPCCASGVACAVRGNYRGGVEIM